MMEPKLRGVSYGRPIEDERTVAGLKLSAQHAESFHGFSFITERGFAIRHSERKAAELGWGETIYRVMEALPYSWRMRRDLKAAIETADQAYADRLRALAIRVGQTPTADETVEFERDANGVWELSTLSGTTTFSVEDIPDLATVKANHEGALFYIERHLDAVPA